MPGPLIGARRSLLAGGGAGAASQQLLDAVNALDADASVYDPDNASTWMLRESSQFYVDTEDGMGNRVKLTQATESAQPAQKTLSTGRRVWDAPTATKFMLADFATPIAQPNTILFVVRVLNATTYNLIDSLQATGGRQLIATNSSANWRQFAGTIVDRNGERDNDWSIIQDNFNGASSQHFIDGAQIGGDADVGASALGGLGILAAAITTANMVGSMGPVIVFSGLKTNAETAGLRTLLNNLYPIGVSE